jgi:hypothetical protein
MSDLFMFALGMLSGLSLGFSLWHKRNSVKISAKTKTGNIDMSGNVISGGKRND